MEPGLSSISDAAGGVYFASAADAFSIFAVGDARRGRVFFVV